MMARHNLSLMSAADSLLSRRIAGRRACRAEPHPRAATNFTVDLQPGTARRAARTRAVAAQETKVCAESYNK